MLLGRLLHGTSKPYQTKYERRAAQLTRSECFDWAETALSGVGRSLSEARRSGDQAALHEALEGAQALLAVISRLTS